MSISFCVGRVVKLEGKLFVAGRNTVRTVHSNVFLRDGMIIYFVYFSFDMFIFILFNSFYFSLFFSIYIYVYFLFIFYIY